MLKAVTKRFTDKSTMKQFKFYCDCYGKPINTEVYEFVSGFKDKKFLSSDEREDKSVTELVAFIVKGFLLIWIS